jgi:hypothetical protein
MRLAQRVRDLLVPFDAGFELPPGVTAVRDPLDAFTDGYRFVVERRARRWAPPHEVVEAPASDSRHVLRGARLLRLLVHRSAGFTSGRARTVPVGASQTIAGRRNPLLACRRGRPRSRPGLAARSAVHGGHPVTGSLALLALALVVCAGGLFAVSEWRQWRPSLGTALLVALVLRLAMFAIAGERLVPYDLNHDFLVAGQNVLEHQDLMLNSRERGWNYLPTYGFVLAAAVALHDLTGLPWLVVARIPAIVSDLGVVVLVHALADREKAGLRAFQYACTPIAVLVSAVHGQMEPLCLLLSLGAFLALRSRPRAGLAGVLIGLAISVKTWPVLFLPALLFALPGWAAKVRLLFAAAGVCLVLLLTQPLTVGTPVRQLPPTVARILSYHSPGGSWGWSSVVYAYSPYTAENYEDSTLWAVVGRVGSVVTLLAVAAALWWWRRADPLVVAGVTASVFQVTTAGHGAQYLTWPAPFLVLRPTRLVPLLQFGIGLWAWAAYVYVGGGLVPAEYASWAVDAWQISSLVLVALFLLALPWGRRRLADGPVAAEPPARRVRRADPV